MPYVCFYSKVPNLILVKVVIFVGKITKKVIGWQAIRILLAYRILSQWHGI